MTQDITPIVATQLQRDIRLGIMMTDPEIKALWYKLGDIPVNEADEIEADFVVSDTLTFEVGTNKLEIWEWFDDVYSKSVFNLMYPASPLNMQKGCTIRLKEQRNG